jgi:signal transduction histidine kinase
LAGAFPADERAPAGPAPHSPTVGHALAGELAPVSQMAGDGDDTFQSGAAKGKAVKGGAGSGGAGSGGAGSGGAGSGGAGSGGAGSGSAARGSAQSPASGSRHSLKNWRVRSRLLLLIGVPTLAALLLGGFSVYSSVTSAQAYSKVQRLASLASSVTGLVQALQDERLDTVTFINLGSNGGRVSAQSTSSTASPELALLRSDDMRTNRAADQVRRLAETIGGSYPALVQQQAQNAITGINDLPALRQSAVNTKLPAATVIAAYGNTITQLLTLENEVAAGSNDASLADDVRVLTLVSAMKEEAAQEQAILTSSLQPDLFGVNPLSSQELSVLNQQEAERTANLAAFNLAATSAQRQLYNNALSSPLAAPAQADMQQAISLLSSGNPSPGGSTVSIAATNASLVISGLRSVEQNLMSSITQQAGSQHSRALTTAVIEAVAALLVLALALLLTTIIGRSMAQPLRRLRAGALNIANVRLPETVRLMSETDGKDIPLEIDPIDVDSTDEIGEVARAFDQVHREALRLAANEAALRGNVNAMFVNLSRRSQTLVDRQIQLIDNLEQSEQDSERLSSLFQLDHLATRMRRNSENLLVLAGHDASRRWNQPVPLVDVLRAAVSEIEQYERVTLNVQPGIAVRGQAVNDVVHLLAELIENATSFSSAERPVTASGHLLSSGGVLLDITDEGVGMSAEEMAQANMRLDNPPVVDVAVSRRMGLFVVARLAATHGIRVRLRPADTGGVTAHVWLPDESVTREGAISPVPGMRRGDGAMADTMTDLATGLGSRNGSRLSSVEAEITAARTPKFDERDDSGQSDLGLRRVPGMTGSRPSAGWAAATGPLPRISPEAIDSPDLGGTAAFTRLRPEAEPGVTPEPAETAEAETDGPEPASTGTGAGPVLGAPATGAPSRSASPDAEEPRFVKESRFSLEAPATNGDVIIPPAEGGRDEYRLPIFEAVESDWFRRGRHPVGWALRQQEERAANGWTSPADEGWRAAEVAAAPSSAGVTSAGLPKREPQANLVPGAAPATVGMPQAAPTGPTVARSAAATRDRFASFQRGVREGRAAAGEGDMPDGEDAAPDGEDQTS